MAKIQKSACQRLMCIGVFWVSIASLLNDNYKVEMKNTRIDWWLWAITSISRKHQYDSSAEGNTEALTSVM